MGCLVVLQVLVAPIAGRLSDRQGWRARIVMTGVATMVPGVLMVGVGTSAGMLAGGLALIGFGMGSLASPLLALLGDLVPPAMRGSAVGCLQLFGDLGGTLGPIIGTSMFGMMGAAPYVATAALLVLVLPFIGWLASAERERAAGRLVGAC